MNSRTQFGRVVASAGFVAVLAFATAVAGGSPAQAEPLTFENGGPITTTAGDLMHAHGAGVIKEGDYYYMVGEQRVDGGHLFEAVSMYRSTDLVNWTHANDILTKDSHPDLDPANLERPKVVYNAEYDHYVMWAHKENGEHYGDAEVTVAVSDTIDGDYTYIDSFRPLGHMSRDLTVYVDDDGSAYLLSAANENADLNVYRLTDDYLGVEELVHSFPWQYRESPAVFKRNGVYFLMTSGLTGWSPNQQKYATTTDFPTGQWSGWRDIGTWNGYDSQTTNVLEVSGSETTSYMYMGDRWAGAWGGTPNESGYVWLPLRFTSDTTMALDWYPRISIDTVTGVVTGQVGEQVPIVSRSSGKCVDVAGGSSADGAALVQYACNGADNQDWRLQPTWGGYYQIVSSSSGKCIDLADESTANGARIIQWPCNGQDNQQWQLREVAGGHVEIVSRYSGKCLDVDGSSTADAAPLLQWDCWGGANQQWSL